MVNYPILQEKQPLHHIRMKEKANQTEKAKRDLALLKQAVDEGSQQAWTELMKIYRDTIFFMLLKITGNPDDAEDLCIETFGKAFTHIHQYNDKYAFSTWLFKIASNHGIDFIRKKQKKRAEPGSQRRHR